MKELYQGKKDDQWYKKMVERYMPTTWRKFDESVSEKLKLYHFFNGDISDFVGEINEMCNDALTSKVTQENILHYNKLRNKYDKLEGDFLERGNHHKMLLLSAHAIQNKDEQLQQALAESVEKDLELVFKRSQEGLKDLSEQELQQWIEEQRGILTPRDINYRTFNTDREIYKSKMLKYIYQEGDIQRKQQETLKDRFIVDEPYVYVTWKHGKPHAEVRNPLYTYAHRPNNEQCISKSDYIVYQDKLTIAQFLDEYINQLEDEDIEQVIHVGASNLGLTKDHLDKFIYHHRMLQGGMYGNINRNLVGLYDTNEEFSNLYKQSVLRTHMEFKAYDEFIVYTYMDDYNSPITVLLNGNTDIIPKNASKVKYTNKYGVDDWKWKWGDDNGSYEAYKEYIPVAHEVEIVASQVYTKMREVPMQPRYSNDPIGQFRLSTFGGPTNNRNSKTISLMMNAMPYAKQLLAVKALIDKEISKYRGSEIIQDIAQVPQDLKNGDTQEDLITTVEAIAKKTGTRWVDSNASMNGLPNPQRGRAVDVIRIGQASELMYLNQLADMIDVELGLACGVNKPAEGQVTSGTNVTDNQQSLVQMSIQTQPFYKAHSKLWADVLTRLLDFWDVYFEKYFESYPDSKNCILEFVAPEGKEMIKVFPEYLSPGETGLFVVDGYGDQRYQEFMLQKVIQNTQDTPLDAISDILKNISSNMSKEEIHRKISMFADDQRKRTEQQQKAEMEYQMQQVNAQRANMEFESQLRIAEAIAISNDKKEHDITLAQIEADDRRLANDVNLNNMNDQMETEKLKIDANKEMLNTQIEADKELEKIKTDGKILVEKSKPKPVKAKT